MLCSGEINSWAESISSGFEDSSLSPSSVAIWLRNNLGKLNLAIKSDYSLNESGCIVPDFTPAVSGIYEEIFQCYYLSRKAISIINSGGGYDIAEVNGTDQGSLRMVSKNERVKTLRTMVTDCEARLNQLIKWYNGQYNSGALVGQVVFDNRGDVAGAASHYYNCQPPSHLYSSYNSVWNGAL